MGQTLRFSFLARTPRVFVYRCGTPSILLYMANDRYGAIVVDPARPLPPTDVTFVIVQSEWYTHLVQDTLMAGDYPSAFHTIGAMFAPFYPGCDTTHALTGVSTYSIAAGQGVMLDLIIPQAGKYPIGDHSMCNMMLGATDVLEVAR